MVLKKIFSKALKVFEIYECLRILKNNLVNLFSIHRYFDNSNTATPINSEQILRNVPKFTKKKKETNYVFNDAT